MKRLLIPIVVLFVGCGEAEELSREEIIERINDTGIITEEQMQSLGMQPFINLTGILCSLTSRQKA